MLISIIIPCYNSEKFISKTLDMLISQDLENCEVIVVNDGSTDNTAQIVQQYVINNSKIHLINKENEGVSVARNIGIDNASGEYIYFLDSDDSLADNTLFFFKKQLFEHPSLDIYAFGYITRTNGVTKKTYICSTYNDCVMDKAVLTKQYFTKKLPIHICSGLYKKSFIIEKQISFTPGVRIGEDVEFILKAILQAQSLFYNSRICFLYQIRNDSTMQGYKTYKNVNSWLTNKMIIDNLGCSEYERYYNYWLINRYIVKLFVYLKYGENDDDIKNSFLNSDYFLSLPTEKYGKYFYIAKVIKLIQVKSLFKLFKK